jgi:hypothetical protein
MSALNLNNISKNIMNNGLKNKAPFSLAEKLILFQLVQARRRTLINEMEILLTHYQIEATQWEIKVLEKQLKDIDTEEFKD